MNSQPENTRNNLHPQDAGDSIQASSGDQNQDQGSPQEADFIPALNDPMTDLQSQLADAERRVLLAHADLDNFRRRTRRDVQDQLRYAALPMMTEMLDAFDNLNRAIEAHERDANSAGLFEGMKLVAAQIASILSNHGCQKIEAVGQSFDPSLHQAVQVQASAEFPPNTVIADLRPGYQLHDRVIRPSQVFVSKSVDG